MHLEQGTQDYFNHNLFCSFFQCYSMLLERIQLFARITVLKDKTYCFFCYKKMPGSLPFGSAPRIFLLFPLFLYGFHYVQTQQKRLSDKRTAFLLCNFSYIIKATPVAQSA